VACRRHRRGYGLWSLWWWTIERAGGAAAFAAYTLALTLALMLAYGLAPRLGLKPSGPPAWKSAG